MVNLCRYLGQLYSKIVEATRVMQLSVSFKLAQTSLLITSRQAELVDQGWLVPEQVKFVLLQQSSWLDYFNFLNKRTHDTELLLHSDTVDGCSNEDRGLGRMPVDCQEDTSKSYWPGRSDVWLCRDTYH